MGMYDTIGDEQVKCFWVPILDIPKDEKEIDPNKLWNIYWCSGGSLDYYEKKSDIPYRKNWYNYTPNFNIFDDRPEMEETDCVLHICRDGKYVKSIYGTSKCTDKYFSPEILNISYNGDYMQLNTSKEFKDYLEKLKFQTECHNKAFKDYKAMEVSLRTLLSDAQVNGDEDTVKGLLKQLQDIYNTSLIKYQSQTLGLFDGYAYEIPEDIQHVYDLGAVYHGVENLIGRVDIDGTNPVVIRRLDDLKRNFTYIGNWYDVLRVCYPNVIRDFAEYSGLPEEKIREKFETAKILGDRVKPVDPKER